MEKGIEIKNRIKRGKKKKRKNNSEKEVIAARNAQLHQDLLLF